MHEQVALAINKSTTWQALPPIWQVWPTCKGLSLTPLPFVVLKLTPSLFLHPSPVLCLLLSPVLCFLIRPSLVLLRRRLLLPLLLLLSPALCLCVLLLSPALCLCCLLLVLLLAASVLLLHVPPFLCVVLPRNHALPQPLPEVLFPLLILLLW
jgi:hypothetical protein